MVQVVSAIEILLHLVSESNCEAGASITPQGDRKALPKVTELIGGRASMWPVASESTLLTRSLTQADHHRVITPNRMPGMDKPSQ